jgi:RNA polymerase sigma-54 factor
MAISTKLMMRQGQPQMTPQLLGRSSCCSFPIWSLPLLHDEFERNPLLEAQEGDGGVDAADPSRAEPSGAEPFEGPQGDWAQQISPSTRALRRSRRR